MRRVLHLAFWLGVVALLLMTLGPWQTRLQGLLEGDRAIARMEGGVIRQSDVATVLRDWLWRSGETWDSLTPEVQQQRRQQVLQELVDQNLVRAARLRSPAVKVEADEELHWFQRQLAFTETRYGEALQNAGWTEAALRERMAAQLLDQAWLEGRIAPQLAAVTEAEAKVWFEAHKAAMKVPVATHAAHLFLSSHDPAQPDRKPRIEQFSADLKADKISFEELVDEFTEDARSKLRQGDLGWFTSARMPPDFMAAVDRLKPGQISGPVQTRLGWHLIKLIERKPARELTFEEAKGEVLGMLRNERRKTAVKTVLAELRGCDREAVDTTALAAVSVRE